MRRRGYYAVFLAMMSYIGGMECAILPASVSTSPPSCLGDLAFLSESSSSNVHQQYCKPNRFIEISFKLKFGCNTMNYFIDQGVRLEVGTRNSDETTTWDPVRFYAVNLTVPADYNSFVALNHSTNATVMADALRYSSSLPLKVVEAGQNLIMREYLCGKYVDILVQSTSKDLRFRWMQRFGKQAGFNEAPWIMDDVAIKLWNGSCFSEIVRQDFTTEPSSNDPVVSILAGDSENPPCQSPGMGHALYFREPVTSEGSTRRSIVLTVNGDHLRGCDDTSTAVRSADSLADCPVEAVLNGTASITCTTGGAVECSCDPGTEVGVATGGNSTRCQMLATPPRPTTTMATTTMAPTTTAAASTAMMTTTTTTEAAVQEVIDDLKREVTVMALENLLEKFARGGVPQKVSDVVVNATAGKLKAISAESDPSAGGEILKSLDLFALQGYNASLGKVTNELYSFDVEDFDEGDIHELKEESSVEGIEDSKGQITLPGELLLNVSSASGSVRAAYFIYNNLSGVLPAVSKDGDNITINSPVVSASLACGDSTCLTSHLELKNPVHLVISHFKKLDDSDEATCQFFDLSKNVWSKDGCLLMKSNSTHSECACEHLTHFAILLSPKAVSVKDELALQVIGYVGVAISLVCMIATIAILTFLKPLRGMRTYIHVNLCICLSLAQLLFITGINRTGTKEVCQGIAIVLHYLFLATFMWMLMEGVVLYVVLVRVFIKKQRKYIAAFTLVSYGLPALYLCLTVPLGLVLRGPDDNSHYGPAADVDACWLRADTHFVWAFIAPVIIVILINCGFFVMSITIMCKHQKRGTDKSRFEVASNWLKTSISLMVVMGITWIIGVLVFHEALVFVAYIFTITTAFQGAIIFILFVLLSKQVRDHYGSWWKSKKSESEVLSKLFPSSESKSTSLLSRTGTRTSSFLSRGNTFRSTLPYDETEVKLKDIKEVSCADDQDKWTCSVDLKTAESMARLKEKEEKDDQTGGEQGEKLKIPVEALELSGSRSERGGSDSDHVALGMEDRVLNSPTSVTDSAHSTTHLLSDSDSCHLTNGGTMAGSGGGKNNGTISNNDHGGTDGTFSGSGHMTNSDSGRTTSSSIRNGDIHLVDAAAIS